MENAQNFITKEFLKSNLPHQQIKSFTVKEGSKPGDNFMSLIYCITVEYEKGTDQQINLPEEEHEHLVLKCFPTHPSRQKFIMKANLFYNELYFYKELAKDLVQFQAKTTDTVGNSIKLSIPQFLGGAAINYSEEENNSTSLSNDMLYNPLNNYILMTDMRKQFGFKMPDSKIGLDEAHMKLAFTELAVLHALSWGLNCSNSTNGNLLLERHPFLNKQVRLDPERRSMWKGMLLENAEQAIKAIDSALGSGNHLSEAIKDFADGADTIAEFFRNQDAALEPVLQNKLQIKMEDELPTWRGLCHADAWTNNLLFQYDEGTGIPQKVVFVDFPLVKFACPTLDLVCLVYTSTRKTFRQSGLSNCLEIYYKKFLEVCKLLKADLPKQFNLETLKKKFHVSKLVGLYFALLSLPFNLIEKDSENSSGGDADFADAPDMDKMDKSASLEAMFHDFLASGSKGSLYKEWMLELVQELYEEGVV